MNRKLFCELSPFAYNLSVFRCRMARSISDCFSKQRFAQTKSKEPLECLIYKHNSLIRRKLGNEDMMLLQNNKAVNLGIAAPKINGIVIRPGETFSFWRLIGNTTAQKGYKEGLTISNSKTQAGIGGGMCQMTNLIHWMVLHSPLTIVEHHHHDGFDLFPDYNRQVPFGMGTSIMYNYLDYRVKNNTDATYQIVIYTTDEYLCGELRADKPLKVKYHIETEDEHFIKLGDNVYRKGKVYRSTIDKATGNVLSRELIKDNHAKVMYDTSNLKIKTAGE